VRCGERVSFFSFSFYRAAGAASKGLLIEGALLLDLSLNVFDPNGQSEAFTRPAYRRYSQPARWKRGIISPLHE
jgi:hypothetical protein